MFILHARIWGWARVLVSIRDGEQMPPLFVWNKFLFYLGGGYSQLVQLMVTPS